MSKLLRQRWIALLLVVNIGAPASYWLYWQQQGNFHTVSPGNLYRSRQLSPSELTDYVTKYRILSVLNLRGEKAGSSWYQEEKLATQALGIRHYDYRMSANHDVDNETIGKILHILRQAPKPVLVHCNFGSDRAGLISALYLYQIEGKTPEEAYDQLSILYLRFPYLGNRSAAMDRSFWRYVNGSPPSARQSWLQMLHSRWTHQPEHRTRATQPLHHRSHNRVALSM